LLHTASLSSQHGHRVLILWVRQKEGVRHAFTGETQVTSGRFCCGVIMFAQRQLGSVEKRRAEPLSAVGAATHPVTQVTFVCFLPVETSTRGSKSHLLYKRRT